MKLPQWSSFRSRPYSLGIALASLVLLLYLWSTDTVGLAAWSRHWGDHDDYRILIVQDIRLPASTSGKEPDGRVKLYKASIESHRRYAEVWGYGYMLNERDWAAEKGESAFVNKLWAVVVAMERELEKDDGAEWLLVTDGDTLILDPAVALEYLLPPGSGHVPGSEDPSIADAPSGSTPPIPSPAPPDPHPLILANQDGNGFNAGVVFFRIARPVLAFLRSALALEPQLAAEHGSPPSDQHLLGWALHRPDAAVARALYEIPMMWANEYWLTRDEGSQRADGIEWTPQLQIHLCNGRWMWSTPRWDVDVVGHANGVYDAALQRAREGGRLGRLGAGRKAEARAIREELIRTEERGKALFATRSWWAKAKGGLDGMKWTET